MFTRLASLLAALALAVVGLALVSTPTASASVQARDLNCDDFSSQAAAQANLNANPSDPNGLDADGNGIACESNPCPCSTSTSTPTKPSTPNPTPKPTPKPSPKPKAVLKVVKVIAGDQVRVRLGSQRPYIVRVSGVQAPKGSCERQGARAFLRDNFKPGTQIKTPRDTKAPDRYKGQLLRRVVSNRNVSAGVSIIAAGYAVPADGYKYGEERRFNRLSDKAERLGLGSFGSCT